MMACSYFAKDLPRLMKQQQAKNWEKYDIEGKPVLTFCNNSTTNGVPTLTPDLSVLHEKNYAARPWESLGTEILAEVVPK